ncbi:hypothetical protein NMY22_g8369 [Coprinellus aureogranulatus]|nr:hypothetical protein NMY22_g8369 [Coprinellus aureogranulatus]
MGRRAKYFTREERLIARRAQRALRDSRPGAKEHRKTQNRRAWRRKRDKERLQVEPPAVPEYIRQQAAMEMSDVQHRTVFEEFCEGRDDIELGEINIEWEDFDTLVGAPPYPTSVTLGLDPADDSPILRSAMHGFMAFRYLQYCEDQIKRCQRVTAGRIRAGLETTYRELVTEYNKLVDAAQLHSHQGDEMGATIINHNIKWISRVLVHTVEDMVTVREGCETLIRILVDRKWEIRHGREL